MLVVCTARPELLTRRPGWGGGKPNAATISLSPLSAEETARLVHALLERAVLPADVQTTLIERAGGNPLYAEEFARMVELGNGDETEIRLPESVQGIIAARLDAVPLEEKLLLQDAAVVGKVFWLGAVERIGQLDRTEAEHVLHSLERKEFVRRERRSSVGDESQYLFRHLLVRDVAYSQIPRAARAEKHRVAADWIESLGRPGRPRRDARAPLSDRTRARQSGRRRNTGARGSRPPESCWRRATVPMPSAPFLLPCAPTLRPSTSGLRTTRSALSFSCAWDESRFEQRAVS